MITGKVFNEKYSDKEVVKLTVENNCHNGFQYKEGLNVLNNDEPFNSDPECGPGGLYCCFKEDFGMWVNYGGKRMFNM